MHILPRPRGLVLAALGGAVCVAGWAPAGYWPLILLANAALFHTLVASRTPLEALTLGLAFGIALHLVGHGWMFDALHAKAGLSRFAAAAATLAATCVLAAPTAIGSLLWHVIAGRAPAGADAAGPVTLPQVIAFAMAMTLAEWVRTLPFNGFTSLSVGYGMVDTWFAGVGPLLGLYGVSFIGYCVSGFTIAARGGKAAAGSGLAWITGLSLLSGVAGLIDWTAPSGAPLRFALIQTGVAQHEKFRPDRVHDIVERLIGQIERHPADIVVTPETAVPAALHSLSGPQMSRLRELSRSRRSHIFLGTATIAAGGEGFNSLVHIDPHTHSLLRHDKARLMPFGEYTPTGFTSFTRALRIPFKDLSPGPRLQAPFLVQRHRVGSMICHEDLIGDDARRWLPAATLLINPSNLAWFDGSLAIEQGLDIVRMRALETGRPVLRAANTGVSAHIAANGDIVARLPGQAPGVLHGYVQPRDGLTPFARWGDYPIVAASVIGLAALGAHRRQRQQYL